MSPESIETRFAELRAEVKAWEHQLRMQGGLIAANERMDERIGGVRRDLDAIRMEMNQRFHDLHDEQEQEMRREVENLHERITRIQTRRDEQFRDIDKRIGDVTLTLKADIDDCRATSEKQRGDWTTRRGQNLALMGVILVGILGLVQALLNYAG